MPGPSAGSVLRLIPQVQIDRSSQTLPAAVSDPVFWNDDLRSGPIGRAHIALNDGSQLNLGSNTSLLVLQHDARAQQTSLDLTIGRMRGIVTKLTNPGSKFEVRTPVGVAGLVGTDFSLEVTNDYVELIVFDGAVNFTLFSNGQVILVTTGMKLRIQRTGVVIGPLNASPSDIQTAQSLTDIPSGPAPPAVAARQRLLPVVVFISAAAVTTGIGIYFATREHPPMSPMSPVPAR